MTTEDPNPTRTDTPAVPADPTPEATVQVDIHDDVPTTEEELAARNDILGATVLILSEENDGLRAEVNRLNRLIATGTIGPKDRNDARNALR